MKITKRRERSLQPKISSEKEDSEDFREKGERKIINHNEGLRLILNLMKRTFSIESL